MPVRKDSRGRWHIEVCYRRQRVHKVCPADTPKASAQQLEAQIRKDLFLARSGSSNNLISDALAKYVEDELRHEKSYKDSICHVNRLAEAADGKRLSEAPAVATKFVSDSRGTYLPATINRSLAALRRSCHLAYLLGWVTEPVHLKIKSIPENNERHVYLSKEEIITLVNACEDEETKDCILILAYTGLRLGELLRVRPEHIASGAIRIDANTKTSQPREVPILPIIRQAVKRFPFTYPKRKLQSCFERARTLARMPHVHLHDLRHTCASLLAAEGVSLQIIGAILGHKSQATSQRYAHINNQAVKDAMRKLA